MSAPVIIGDATLYCGDCRDIVPTLGEMARQGKLFDMPAALRPEDAA